MTPKGTQNGSQNGVIVRAIFEVLFKTPLRPTWGPKGLPIDPSWAPTCPQKAPKKGPQMESFLKLCLRCFSRPLSGHLASQRPPNMVPKVRLFSEASPCKNDETVTKIALVAFPKCDLILHHFLSFLLDPALVANLVPLGSLQDPILDPF